MGEVIHLTRSPDGDMVLRQGQAFSVFEQNLERLLKHQRPYRVMTYTTDAGRIELDLSTYHIAFDQRRASDSHAGVLVDPTIALAVLVMDKPDSVPHKHLAQMLGLLVTLIDPMASREYYGMRTYDVNTCVYTLVLKTEQGHCVDIQIHVTP